MRQFSYRDRLFVEAVGLLGYLGSWIDRQLSIFKSVEFFKLSCWGNIPSSVTLPTPPSKKKIIAKKIAGGKLPLDSTRHSVQLSTTGTVNWGGTSPSFFLSLLRLIWWNIHEELLLCCKKGWCCVSGVAKSRVLAISIAIVMTKICSTVDSTSTMVECVCEWKCSFPTSEIWRRDFYFFFLGNQF